MIVLVDTREQAPLEFKVAGNVSKIENIGLLFGDYQAMLEDGTTVPLAFERKSVADLYSTLTHGIDRFKRELERAKAHNFQLYLIIEGSLNEVLEGVGHSKVEPASLVKTIFTFKVKYGLHPVFCSDRDEMRRYMIETWEAFGRNFKAPLKGVSKN